MPGAKNFFPEHHKQFVGIFWGEVSTLGVDTMVDWSEAIFAAGTVFTDYSTMGWTAEPKGGRVLIAEFDQVRGVGAAFNRVRLADFLSGLAKRVTYNNTTMIEYARLRPNPIQARTVNPKSALSRGEISRQVEPMLTAQTTLLVETGDSWFNGIQMNLPEGSRFEIEMQWGWRWLIPGDGAGGLADGPFKATHYFVPDQQPRLYHRGGDTRRPVQQYPELGLWGAGRSL